MTTEELRTSLLAAPKIYANQGGNLYLINGNMTKLENAGLFAGQPKKEAPK